MSVEDDRKALLLRGVLDLCVLALLVRGERYGYELTQALDEAGLGRIKGGTLYPLLARLAEAGYVSSDWRAGEHGPGRKYYAVTERGRAFLTARAESWERLMTAAGALLKESRLSNCEGGTRMTTAERNAYLSELRNQLLGRGVAADDAEDVVREAESHLLDSGEDPHDVLGPVEEFVQAIVSRGDDNLRGSDDRWEYETITGATAFNEMQLLDDAGREGWELIGCAPFKLHVRRRRVGDRRWQYRRSVSGPALDARLAAEGWELATTWMMFRYYRRPLDRAD